MSKIPSSTYLESQGFKTDNMAWNYLAPEVLRLRKILRNVYIDAATRNLETPGNLRALENQLEEEIRNWGESPPSPHHDGNYTEPA